MEEVWSGLRPQDLALLAHELKAPLATIRQLGFLGQEGAPDLWPAIIHESEQALQLVQDLVVLSRLGQSELPLEPLNPRALCESVAAALRPQFSASRRQLQLDLTARADLVWAEPRLLQSAVANLCTNALHYADAHAPSRLFIRGQGERVLIGVRDYGPRLPAAVFRAVNSGLPRPTAISRRPGSSGLGLYIASQFAAAMGAKLAARQHADGVSLWLDLARSRQASFL